MNPKSSQAEAKIDEVYQFKDKESQKMFKDITYNTKELYNIIDCNKPLNIVTKKLMK